MSPGTHLCTNVSQHIAVSLRLTDTNNQDSFGILLQEILQLSGTDPLVTILDSHRLYELSWNQETLGLSGFKRKHPPAVASSLYLGACASKVGISVGDQ